MTPTEVLERAIWEVRAGGSIDNTHTPEVVAALAALGWKVVPIDHFVGDDCTEEDIAHFAALEQVADRETRCARCGLTRRFLYGDRLVEHDFHFGTNLNDGHAFIDQAAEAAEVAGVMEPNPERGQPSTTPSAAADSEAAAWMLRDIDARIHDFLRRLAPSECPVCGHSLEGGSHEHWGMIYEKPVYPTGPIAPSNSAVEEQS